MHHDEALSDGHLEAMLAWAAQNDASHTDMRDNTGE